MFFDTLHLVDEGAIPFTIRGTMAACTHFENSEEINQPGLTALRIRARLDTIFGQHKGPDGQKFLGQHECMMSLNATVRNSFLFIHENNGKPQSRVRGCDLQSLLLLTPYLLDGLFDDLINPLESEDDPSLQSTRVFHNLLQWYRFMRMRGKDMDEIRQMDDVARDYIALAEETYKDYPMKSGKHLMSSNKIHRMVHGGGQTLIGGDRINFEPMAEMGHRTHIQGPQHLTSKSDTHGPGLLSIAERKSSVEEVLCGWQGDASLLHVLCTWHVHIVNDYYTVHV